MPQLTVEQLFSDKHAKLELSWVTGQESGRRSLGSDSLSRPGLGLIGHLNLIHPHRLQVLGAAEISYLQGLERAGLQRDIERLFSAELTAIFIADGKEAPRCLLQPAQQTSTPLFTSPLASQQLINLLRQYLHRMLGELTTMHGVFLDVLGVGVLITGDSSIGKSELALELVSRGHGLVADDVVDLTQIGPDALQGRCPALLRDFLEVRGLGVLNIRTIFGETAVRPKMILKLIVHLEQPTNGIPNKIERLKANAGAQTILGVEIPTVALSVVAGRNLAVLVEAAVRNYILQQRGIDSTRQFIERHAELMLADQVNLSEG
ncbi:MAG: HPr kinase/phosphorylase [Burkholderiales bacterium]|nr:HPr kinase/phosphorylase [Burkholderiales bacterium]